MKEIFAPKKPEPNGKWRKLNKVLRYLYNISVLNGRMLRAVVYKYIGL
jgi:hypothetical protein